MEKEKSKKGHKSQSAPLALELGPKGALCLEAFGNKETKPSMWQEQNFGP